MKKFITTVFLLSAFAIQMNAQTPTYSWAKILAYGSITGTNGQSDQVNCVDAQGNIYVAGGFFVGNAIIGDTTTMHLQSPYQTGMYIAKFNSSGDLVWKKTGFSSKVWGVNLKWIGFDKQDNLYIGLEYGDTLNYDGNQFISMALSTYTELATLCIKKSDGSFISKKTLSTASSNYQAKWDVNKTDELVTVFRVDSLIIKKFSSAGAVTLDKRWYISGGLAFTAFDASQDNIFLAGTFGNNFSISTANFTTTLGQYCAIRFDNSGQVTWSGQGKSTGTGSSVLNSISEDANGNFYVTGDFSGTGTFTGTTQTLFGAGQLFYAKYNAAGNLVWLKQSNSQGTIAGKRIRVGSDNKLYMMGVLGSQLLYLGGDSALAATVISSTDRCFLAQMDTTGNTLWLKRVNDAGGIMGVWNIKPNVEMYIDGVNNIYFTGSYDFLKNMGIGTFTLPIIAYPSNKFFFAKTSVSATSTGIFEQTILTHANINIYPNPAKDKIRIDFNSKGILEISIFDITGKLMLEKEITQNNNSIDVSNLHQGIYFIKAKSEQGVITRKLLIQ